MSVFRVSVAAQTDIRKIGRYTQNTWGAAQRRLYLTGLNDKFDRIAEKPELEPERRDFEPPVHIQHYQKHLIVYVVDDASVLIVRVLHQNMDVSAHFAVGRN